MATRLVINETNPQIIVRSAGSPGRTIISGEGDPSNTVGVPGDFYFDTDSTRFWGPKAVSNLWVEESSFVLDKQISYTYSWELASVSGPLFGIYSVEITHNLGFHPNVTVKTSAGDVLETGIDYNNVNKITLTMAQPFSGTAYLS